MKRSLLNGSLRILTGGSLKNILLFLDPLVTTVHDRLHHLVLAVEANHLFQDLVLVQICLRDLDKDMQLVPHDLECVIHLSTFHWRGC